MKTSNLFKSLALTFCFASAVLPSMANDKPANAETPATATSAIAARVAEIKAMDFSTMSAAEKKALKTELKMAKKDSRESAKRTKEVSGGVYISVGSLLLIILLLIILL